MRPKDSQLAGKLNSALSSFHTEIHPLPGIKSPDYKAAFVEQLVESVHRVQFVKLLASRPVSEKRIDPHCGLFDPIKGAEYFKRSGKLDDAFWLVFLSVHFGKSLKYGWLRIADVYGSVGGSPIWTWPRATKNTAQLLDWLNRNQASIRGRFGNHRKYQSLSATSSTGTGAAISSYIKWVLAAKDHQSLFENARREAGDTRKAFDLLYTSMNQVASFGRMAKFDYLTMVGKLNLADIEPGSTYMDGATGPFDGANLLFDSQRRYSRSKLESLLGKLDEYLQVGMQVIEDALCNWQKSPQKFRAFRG